MGKVGVEVVLPPTCGQVKEQGGNTACLTIQREAKQTRAYSESNHLKKNQELPRWEGSGTFRGSVAASPGGCLRQHRLSRRHSATFTPAALTRRRSAFLLLKPSRPPSSTFPPSTTIISLLQLRLFSSRHISSHNYIHTTHLFQDADLRQDP